MSNVPVYEEYRGVRIGMTAKDVRAKLNHLKKGDRQDFFAFSERELAQIYYDDRGQVIAISIDYFGNKSDVPTADAVLGTALQPRADGSMFRRNRYPEAGYSVSYSRTTGEKPFITITMQRIDSEQCGNCVVC